MNRNYLLLIPVALLYVAVIWLADPLLLSLFVYIPLFWIGAPTAVAALIFLFYRFATGRSWRLPLMILAIVCSVALLITAAIPLNIAAQDYAVAAAKAYPALIAPTLEKYREIHGAYPTSLDQLPTVPYMPRLLRRDDYRSDGQTYSFWFPVPGGMIDVWTYHSQTGQWYLST